MTHRDAVALVGFSAGLSGYPANIVILDLPEGQFLDWEAVALVRAATEDEASAAREHGTLFVDPPVPAVEHFDPPLADGAADEGEEADNVALPPSVSDEGDDAAGDTAAEAKAAPRRKR